MNLKTTLLLAILVGAGAAGVWYLDPSRTQTRPETTTLKFLESDLTAQNLIRIELLQGKNRRFLLEKTGNDWSLPGGWPVRAPETQELLDTVTHLHSRFTPIPIAADENLDKYGLGDDALTLKLQVGGKEHTLAIGEEPATENRFNRATYVRLDKEPEVVRLGPGIVAALDRPQDYFQQRRLFPSERVAKEEDSKEKVQQVRAQEIRIQGPEGKVTLAKEGGDWKIIEPTTDRPDPERLKTLLAGLPDFWADRFVDKKDKKLDDFGLEKPEYAFTVTRPGGAAVKLLVGKVSDTKERMTFKPAPPNQFGMPQRPIPVPVKEEYRYAKLENNDQIFEIKTDKLKDVAVKLDELRDPQLARFKTDEVHKVEIQQPKETLVLIKDKDKWKFEKPVTLDAESQPITELLDKLSGLRASDKDIRDNADLKALGLEKPAFVVKLSVEEGKQEKEKEKGKEAKKREIVYQIGTSDKEKGKLFIRVAGWPRINALGDDLLKLVERPALAYRNRKVLDLASADIGKIEITRGGEQYTLEKKDGDWKLTKPVEAKADVSKADQLAGDLAKLESAEFIADAPKVEDLEKTYGLAKPALRAVIHLADAKKPAHALAVGNQRAGKDEWYARLDEGAVFTIKKDARETLDRESLAYRPLQLWQFAADDLREIRIQKEGSAYTLKHLGKDWKVAGPFEAPAVPTAVESITDEVAKLRGERFVAHAEKDLAKFGLDKPYVSVEILANNEKEKGKEKEAKRHRLLIGKPVEKEDKNRYAMVEGDSAVFTISDKNVSVLAKDALDLLDKNLISVSTKAIERVEAKGSAPFRLEQKKGEWHVVGSPAPEFKAEDDAVQSFLRPWANLRAERVAAYGPKIDWKQYGLDQPALTLTITLAGEDKDKKPSEHTLILGKDGAKGERYARLDQRPEAVVLDAGTSADLAKSHLDFVNHRVLKYDLDTVTGIARQMKDGDLELVKRDDQWRFAKPDKAADDLTVGDVLEKTFRLRAERVAAYPVKDLKPFGLEQPAATVTLKLADATGAPTQHVIKVGDLAKEPGKTNEGQRYALVDKGEAVVVLSAELSKHLVAPVLHFADRNLASFGSADKITLERGPRKLTFAKPASTWELVAPIKADAEDAALDEFVKDLRRLRADEIVAEKGDLKQFGLDRPQALWTVSFDGKEVLSLHVGNPEPVSEKEKEKEKTKESGTPRRYAKLDKSDTIFLLNPKQSARALDEYRSRKPWPALDAVQVEKISYSGPAPFVMEKSDNVWHVAGKPEVKVNAKAVSDTLDALAALKVEHWLADEKGDLQLHGLQPPQMSLELQTTTGKRTLLIGRREGESQRLYAAVAGNDAIFVIGEEDARRIVRPLAAFLEK